MHSRNPELVSLAHESDSELFEQGLLSAAGRLENSGQEELASRVYAEIRGENAALAQRRLKALNGGGEIGSRSEVLSRHLAREAFDPATLLSLSAAGAVYRLTRAAALAQLVSLPAHVLTRGLALPLLSGLAAFAAEATIFPLSARAARSALNSGTAPRGDLSLELQKSFLGLGALRGFSSLAQTLVPAGASCWRQAAAPIVTLGGLFVVHRLEEGLGWRPRGDASVALADSLALFLQFQVANRLSEGAMGNAWRRSSMEWNVRAEMPRGWNTTYQLLAVKAPLDFALAQEGSTESSPPSSSPSSRPTMPTAILEAPVPASKETPAASEVKRRRGSEEDLKEFKVEAEHLAHDLNSGLMSLTYNLPMIREWLWQLSLLQSLVIRHYRCGGGELPPELVRRVEELYQSVIPFEPRKGEEDSPPTLPSLERQLDHVQNLSFRLMDSMDARIGELVEMANSFRNLSSPDKGLNLIRLDRVLEEDFVQSHLGASTRLSFSSPERVFVVGPQEVIKRLFQNLLVNTREALEGHDFPIVRVQVELANLQPELLQELLQPEYGFEPQAGIFWKVRIQDNGMGIDPHNIPKIFDSGFSTKVGKQNGSTHPSRGLGLAQVRKAVRERGGFVRVDRGIGSGTVFDVYLPDIVSQHTEP